MISQLNGFLLIDKPDGITSFDVIRLLRRQTGIRTFGHAGTLDPFATGLLIIAVNKYTRLLPLLDDADKTYEAVMQFGTATSTGDTEGEVIDTDDKIVSLIEIEALIPDILAITEMHPPKYSAVKVDGKRAYDLARQGKDFELPAKAMTVLDFAILEYEYPLLKYRCRVSKGTYIRALSEWIAAKLHTVAYTKELRRTAINNIKVTDANTLEAINSENINNLLVSVRDICDFLPTVTLEQPELVKLRNGNPVFNPGIDEVPVLLFCNSDTLTEEISESTDDVEDGICCGIAYRKDNQLYPKVNI